MSEALLSNGPLSGYWPLILVIKLFSVLKTSTEFGKIKHLEIYASTMELPYCSKSGSSNESIALR